MSIDYKAEAERMRRLEGRVKLAKASLLKNHSNTSTSCGVFLRRPDRQSCDRSHRQQP
jgi:hypothetical protein